MPLINCGLRITALNVTLHLELMERRGSGMARIWKKTFRDCPHG
jgi:hypothetical protein